jgi:lysophospholipase L1-like esterase
MPNWSKLFPTLSGRRLVVLSILLAPVVYLGIWGAFWMGSRTPQWVFWKIGLVLLLITEVAYCIAALLSLIGSLACGVLLLTRSRRRVARGVVARGLLLSGSTLAALALAEAGSAVWQERSHRGTTLPTGGLGKAKRNSGKVAIAELPVIDELRSDFPDSHDDRQIDVVVLGESSAEGVPFNQWLSIGALIKWKLQEVFPARKVEHQTLAMSAETLERQQKKIEWLRRRPEIMIIYCGHNEFSTRLGAERDLAYYFDDELPTTWSRLVERVEACSKMCEMLRENVEKCRIAIPPPEWGARELIDSPAYSSTEYTTLLVDFRRRLELLVTYAMKLGALPVLIVPAANDAGFDPNRSFLPASTPRREREAFRHDFLDAKRLEPSDPAAAIAAYRSLVAKQPGFAETHYRLAQLLEKQLAWEEAYEHYAQARNQDGYPMRMLTSFQDVYREVGSRHDCIMIDSQEYFHAIGQHGLLDDVLFQDGMHPSLRGQIALAQRVLQALRDRRVLGWPEDKLAPVIEPSECVKRFGFGPAEWLFVCRWNIMFYDMTHAIRYEASDRLRKRQRYVAAASRLAAGESPEAQGFSNLGIPEPVPVHASIKPR